MMVLYGIMVLYDVLWYYMMYYGIIWCLLILFIILYISKKPQIYEFTRSDYIWTQ